MLTPATRPMSTPEAGARRTPAPRVAAALPAAAAAAAAGLTGGGVRPRVPPVAAPGGSGPRPQQPVAEARETARATGAVAGSPRAATTGRRSGHLVDIRS